MIASPFRVALIRIYDITVICFETAMGNYVTLLMVVGASNGALAHRSDRDHRRNYTVIRNADSDDFISCAYPSLPHLARLRPLDVSDTRAVPDLAHDARRPSYRKHSQYHPNMVFLGPDARTGQPFAGPYWPLMWPR